MATALEGGNLIVPVIKDANHLNLTGLAKSVNDLSTERDKINFNLMTQRMEHIQ